jgi:hypothetical protein
LDAWAWRLSGAHHARVPDDLDVPSAKLHRTALFSPATVSRFAGARHDDKVRLISSSSVHSSPERLEAPDEPAQAAPQPITPEWMFRSYARYVAAIADGDHQRYLGANPGQFMPRWVIVVD